MIIIAIQKSFLKQNKGVYYNKAAAPLLPNLQFVWVFHGHSAACCYLEAV